MAGMAGQRGRRPRSLASDPSPSSLVLCVPTPRKQAGKEGETRKHQGWHDARRGWETQSFFPSRPQKKRYFEESHSPLAPLERAVPHYLAGREEKGGGQSILRPGKA